MDAETGPGLRAEHGGTRESWHHPKGKLLLPLLDPSRGAEPEQASWHVDSHLSNHSPETCHVTPDLTHMAGGQRTGQVRNWLLHSGHEATQTTHKGT